MGGASAVAQFRVYGKFIFESGILLDRAFVEFKIKCMKKFTFLLCATAFAAVPSISVYAEGVSLRDSVLSAAGEFKSAFASADAYFVWLRNLRSETSSISSKADGLLSGAQSSRVSLSDVKKRLAEFKVQFAECVSGADSSAKNLESSVSAMSAVGVPDAAVREIFDKLDILVLKNPGEKYQDKRYYDSVKSAYEVAKRRFENAQKNAVSTCAYASVSAPRIHGVNSTLEMCGDYMEKLDAISAENFKSAESAVAVSRKLSADYSKRLADYAQLGKICSQARADVLAAFFAYCNRPISLDDTSAFSGVEWQLNLPEFPDSRAGAGVNSRLGALSKMNVARARSASFPSAKYEPAADFAGDKFSAASENAAAKPQKVRAEILEACAKITVATAKLNATACVLTQQDSSARYATARLEDFSQNASGLLAETIAALASAQKLSSEILELQIRQKTLESQNAVSAVKMEKLLDSAKSGFSSAAKKGSEILKVSAAK